MENKILKKADVQKLNLERGYDASLFEGSMVTNLDANKPVYLADAKGQREPTIVDTEKANWVGTKEYEKHWNSIKVTLDKIRADKDKQNTAQFPSDYYDLIEKISLDITKRRIQEVDYTALVTMEITRLDFSKSVNLKEFLGFVGQFLENNLAGDSVPLLQQKTGVVGAVDMQGYALGHIRSLEDVLYNLDIYTIQKVNEAYTRAFIGRRNHLVWNPMIALTGSGWSVGQTVAADTTSGATISERMYRTIDAAIEMLGNLYDFQTNQEINLPRIVIATGRNVDARKINRAISGQLQNSKGINSNREALEIDQIWMYKGDSFFYGKEKVSYPGIAANKAYIFIPGPSGAPNYSLIKRNLVSVSSPGDALKLSQGADAKYFIQSKYNDEWYGTSSGNATIAANTDHVWGYVVEVNLPA